MNITLLYAALLTFLFVILSVRTILLRRKFQIGVGHSGNINMLRAMRVHANFSEYVPLALILIFLVEAKSSSQIFIHFLGLSLFLGRISHAYGVSQEKEKLIFRQVGMFLTFSILIICAGFLLVSFLKGM